MAIRWDEDIKAGRAFDIQAILLKYPILQANIKIAGELYDIRNFIVYFLKFKLIPYLTDKVTFNPPVNVTNGKINIEANKKYSNKNGDYLISYLKREIEILKNQGNAKIIQIQHPARDCVHEVFEFLYGHYEELNIILLVPSRGYISQLFNFKYSQNDIMNTISEKWCEAIRKLLLHFPDYSIKIKLHPNSSAEPIWGGIIEKIIKIFPEIEIINTMESAEWHVVRSKLIVGDVSSVLWWSCMIGQKKVISLNIFDYPAGDEMKEYIPLIHVVDNVKEIDSHDFIKKLSYAEIYQYEYSIKNIFK
jgi:hypothetical protein